MLSSGHTEEEWVLSHRCGIDIHVMSIDYIGKWEIFCPYVPCNTFTWTEVISKPRKGFYHSGVVGANKGVSHPV